MILIKNPNGGHAGTKTTLAIASASLDCAGKTVVVTSPQVVTTAIAWPSDRELSFEKGGYVTFTGAGALTGLQTARPEDFGAIGDNVANDAPAILNAIKAASKVVFKKTTYKGTSAVAVTKDVDIEGNGAVLNFTTGAPSFTGSATAGTAITSPILYGSKSISVAGAYAAGDLIEVLNNVNYSFSKHRDYYKDGEFAKVVSYSAGTLVVDRPLRAYPNTTTLIIKHTPIQVNIDKLKVRTSTDVSAAVTMEHTLSSRVTDCDFEGGSQSGLGLYRSYDANIVRTRAHNKSPDTGYQYGLLLSNSSNVSVSGGDFHGTRHGIAMGGAGFSPTFNVTVDGATIGSDLSYSSDTHGGCSKIRFTNNMILNGVGIGGEDVEYFGNTIHATNIGIDYPAINLTEIVGGNIAIERNRIIANQYTTEIMATTSSTFVADINYKYNLKLNDNLISGASTTVTIAKLLVSGDNTNLTLRPSAEIIGNTYESDFTGLLRVLFYANINVAPVTAYPESIVIERFNRHSTMPAAVQIIQASHNLTGCKIVLPSLAYNKNMIVDTGQYIKSEIFALPFNYGTYPPVATATITNNSAVGGLFPFATLNLEATQFTAIVTTGKSADTFTANTPYTVAVSLGGQAQMVE